MRKIADAVVEYFLKHPESSLHKIAKEFNTSRSHIKAILRKNGLYSSDVSKIYEQFNDAMQVKKVVAVSNLRELKITKRYIAAGDFHIPYHDPNAVAAFLEYIKKYQPDKIIITGDFLDCYTISRFSKNPKAFSMEQEFEIGVTILEAIREACPNAEIIFLKGNHELRIEKYINSQASQMATFFNELSEELAFDKLGIKYVYVPTWIDTPQSGERGPLFLDGFYYIHGDEAKTSFGVVNLARTLFFAIMDNVICGHFHRISEYKVKTIGHIVKEAYTHGCLCLLNAEYHPLNQWEQGFLEVLYFEDGTHAVVNHRIIGTTVL